MWSPWGHILMPMALASKVKSLASKPQVLEKSSTWGQHYIWVVKSLWSAWKIFWKTVFSGDLFFFESTCACVLGPWSWAFMSLASRVSVLGRAVLGLGLGFFFCVLGLGLGLEPCVLDSTSEDYNSTWRVLRTKQTVVLLIFYCDFIVKSKLC